MTPAETIEAELIDVAQQFVGKRNTPTLIHYAAQVLEPVVREFCLRFEIGPDGVREV